VLFLFHDQASGPNSAVAPPEITARDKEYQKQLMAVSVILYPRVRSMTKASSFTPWEL